MGFCWVSVRILLGFRWDSAGILLGFYKDSAGILLKFCLIFCDSGAILDDSQEHVENIVCLFNVSGAILERF